MLREPKTLPGDATVADVREILANQKVQMVLLADGPTFRGAVTELPDGARSTEAAVAYADPNAETIAPSEPGDQVFERATASPHRRLIVLADDGALLGLVCLNSSRTGFCQTATRG